jgi:hypothetical protein
MTRIGRLKGAPWQELLAAGVAVLALTVGLARPAGAWTRFIATTGNDSSNACLAPGSPCKTITHALMQAVSGDIISVAAGTYNLPLGETFPLVINQNLTLTGEGAGSTILDATGANRRVITITAGVTATIWGVTITGGAVSCTNSGSGSCVAEGGGLHNDGTLTLTSSTVSGNTASCTSSGSGDCVAEGGGFSNGGTLTLTSSTVSGNTASCTSGSSFSGGAGISNQGVLSLTNVTITGNMAGNGGGGMLTGGNGTASLTNVTISNNTAQSGGGFLNGAGTHSLVNSTVSGNTAESGGGIANLVGSITLTNATISDNTGGGILGVDTKIFGAGISVTHLKNTIVANSLAGPNCSGDGIIASLGHNLDSGSTCTLNGPGDLSNTDPKLGPLQNNGGPTPTHALLPGSPAIDAAGSDCPPPGTDQRGAARPQGAACDIGAYEAGRFFDAIAAASFVTRLYERVLGREPEPDVVEGWVGQIQLDGSVVRTVFAFFSSKEFLDRNNSNAQVLTILYQALLNREPDPEGFDAFMTALQGGRLTRDNLLDIFLDSQEFTGQAGFVQPPDPITAFVTTLYVRILGRGPDPLGLPFFVSQLRQTRTILPTIQQFLASPEFQARQTTNAEFVALLYRVFLNRVPDAAGIASFVTLLTQGTTRDQLLTQFAASPEFQTIQQRLFP